MKTVTEMLKYKILSDKLRKLPSDELSDMLMYMSILATSSRNPILILGYLDANYRDTLYKLQNLLSDAEKDKTRLN